MEKNIMSEQKEMVNHPSHYGGKPVMSNQITNWRPVKKVMLNGVVTEIKKQ